jgi:hypothetical protein
MLKSIFNNRKLIYMSSGFLVGLGAPILWSILNLLFFRDPSLGITDQIVADIVGSPYHSAVYIYMGLGTALVMAIFGYFVSKVGVSLHERAEEGP